MVSEDGESESEIVFNLLFKYSVQWRIQGGGANGQMPKAPEKFAHSILRMLDFAHRIFENTRICP